MLSAFTARPIIELRQRDKSKIETILAYGMDAQAACSLMRSVAHDTPSDHVSRRPHPRRAQQRRPSGLPPQRAARQRLPDAACTHRKCECECDSSAEWRPRGRRRGSQADGSAAGGGTLLDAGD